MIAEFCTELAGKKKEPNYKKMLESEIETETKKSKGGKRNWQQLRQKKILKQKLK